MRLGMRLRGASAYLGQLVLDNAANLPLPQKCLEQSHSCDSIRHVAEICILMCACIHVHVCVCVCVCANVYVCKCVHACMCM